MRDLYSKFTAMCFRMCGTESLLLARMRFSNWNFPTKMSSRPTHNRIGNYGPANDEWCACVVHLFLFFHLNALQTNQKDTRTKQTEWHIESHQFKWIGLFVRISPFIREHCDKRLQFNSFHSFHCNWEPTQCPFKVHFNQFYEYYQAHMCSSSLKDICKYSFWTVFFIQFWQRFNSNNSSTNRQKMNAKTKIIFRQDEDLKVICTWFFIS